MSPTQKAPAQPTAAKARADHARFKENDRVLRRIAGSLEVAQADLGKLRGNIGTGASDLRRDLARLLRDARRDAVKLSKAARKDLERLQRDMLAAAKPQPKRGAKKPRTASTGKAAGKPRASATKARTGTAKRTAAKRTTTRTAQAKAAKRG